MKRLAACVLALGLCAFVSPDALPGDRRPAPHVSAAPAAAEFAALRQAYSGPAANWPAPWIEPGVVFVEFGPPQTSQRDTRAVELGRTLFHDPILSETSDLSCASCHDPAMGWSDGRAKPSGIHGRQGHRNTPSLVGVAERRIWGWDGAGTSLASQALKPLRRADEMGEAALPVALERLNSHDGYRRRFHEINGVRVIDDTALAQALSAFMSTLEQETRFDAFLAGDAAGLSDRELWGMHLFRTKARCANCHNGPQLTDDQFHNLGLSAFGEPAQDLGRHDVTFHADDTGRFRTPSLRQIGRTAPYMHNGTFTSLAGILNFYMRGGGEVWARNSAEAQRPLYREAARKDRLLHPFLLKPQERDALLAFLNTL
ncbi:cytochrome-c peroxidase [Terrihabitans sp. B22-R8]|uniref:cytochrome-c peroxidase n=1 Tax=Terrihabitans sp. B22-R8 TaxID=3425128 RepID=UPI00403C54F1